MSMTINISCRICRSTRLAKVLDFGMQPLANAFVRAEDGAKEEARYPLEVSVCEECNLAQLIHVVDKEVLFSDYIYFSSVMPKLSNHFERYAEDVIARFLHTPQDLVVEIGSNDGILLQFFKEKGFRVLGVDPAENIAPVAVSRGVETIVDFFTESVAARIVETRGKAEAILGNNVVAHINDYHDLCRGIKNLLADDGVFVFEAPYLVDMFEHLTFDTVYHEHLNFLAIRPLLRLFEQFGLQIFDVQIVPAQGQSIRVFVGHEGKHAVKESVHACVAREMALGLHHVDSYRLLAKKISEKKEQVIALLANLKSQGKKIAAYGAPAKGNTLLNYFGIGTDFLDFAYDDAPTKQGFLTPGMHIPVVDRVYAMAHRPDYYLVLAWNYLSVILEKEKDFLAGGGSFIVPTSGEVMCTQPPNHPTTQPRGEVVRWSGGQVRKVLVCGGAGFIGSNFVRFLYHKYPNYHIFNVDFLTYSGNKQNLADIEAEDAELPPDARRYTFIHGDICDAALLERLFADHHFDMVVNFAAESHVDRSLASSYDFIRTNVLGTHTLIEACRKYGNPRFLQISTDEVYGDVPDGRSAEDAPLNASSPYSASKAGADVLIKSYMRSHRLCAMIIRGSNNFGPYQYPEKLIPLAISNLVEGKRIPVHGTGMHVRSWLHVLDFCRAIDLVLHQSPDNQVYNVSGTPKTNIEVLEAIHRALKLPHHLDTYKVHTNDRPGADTRYAPDDAKIRRELGFAPQYPFDETIANVVQWYLDHESWWREIKAKPVFTEHYKKQERADYY